MPTNNLGSAFIPSNKGGNNRVEAVVYNHRLSIGYVGPERGIPNAATGDPGWIANGLCDIASVINDIPYGGTTPVRPTLANVLNNNPLTGWVIGGPGGFSTFGDPLSAPENKGGLGWMEPFTDGTNGFPADAQFSFTDTNLNTVHDLGEPSENYNDVNNDGVRNAVEARDMDLVAGGSQLNPAMRNVEAAAFINNFSRSVEAFAGDPGSNETLFTPGELAAVRFILTAAQDNAQNPTDPVNLVPNPNFNSSLKSFYSSNPSINVAGQLPVHRLRPRRRPHHRRQLPRRQGSDPQHPFQRATNNFSDKVLVLNGDQYITEAGTLLTYGANLRSATSSPATSQAMASATLAIPPRCSRPTASAPRAATWTPLAGSGSLAALAATLDGSSYNSIAGADLCIEVIGDFNGDGSFDKTDVRYFADGLALTTSGTPVLNRKQGFIDVDTAYLAAGGASINFFGSHPRDQPSPTTAGDSRLISSLPQATSAQRPSVFKFKIRSFPPLPAANSVIDGERPRLHLRRLRRTGAIAGSADWPDLNEASLFDLSADVTGDLGRQQDVTAVLHPRHRRGRR